jgi:hypothetical protein
MCERSKRLVVTAGLAASTLWLVAMPAAAQVSALSDGLGQLHLRPLDSFAETSLEFPDLLQQEALGRLISGAGGRTFRGGSARSSGLFFEMDLGSALTLPVGDAVTRGAAAFGGGLGYRAANGLSMMLRYDDLGLPVGLDGTRFQFATYAMRYTFPYPIPMPYVEAAVGLSFVTPSGPLGSEQSTGTALGAGGAFGFGVAIPLSHHAAIDVGLRDWTSLTNGSFFQVLSLTAGIEFTVGGGPSGPR